jgi:hypothetical protein
MELDSIISAGKLFPCLTVLGKKRVKICVLSGLVLYISITMTCTSSKLGMWVKINISVNINSPSTHLVYSRVNRAIVLLNP